MHIARHNRQCKAVRRRAPLFVRVMALSGSFQDCPRPAARNVFRQVHARHSSGKLSVNRHGWNRTDTELFRAVRYRFFSYPTR